MQQQRGGGFLAVDPATAAAVAGGDPRWQRFLGYWQDLSTRLGRIPARREIDPAEMGAPLLGNLFLIDILPPAGDLRRNRYRFRLVGGEITARELVRPGMYLDELSSPETTVDLERHYLDAVAGRIRLRETTLSWESRHKDHIRYQAMVLPLAGDAGAVEHLIGCAIYDDERRR
jgi:hypothetical protein